MSTTRLAEQIVYSSFYNIRVLISRHYLKILQNMTNLGDNVRGHYTNSHLTNSTQIPYSKFLLKYVKNTVCTNLLYKKIKLFFNSYFPQNSKLPLTFFKDLKSKIMRY